MYIIFKRIHHYTFFFGRLEKTNFVINYLKSITYPPPPRALKISQALSALSLPFRRIALALLLFAVGCDQAPAPTAPEPVAPKINPQTPVAPGERLYVVWPCGAQAWQTARDSTYTVFYGLDSRLAISPAGIHVSEYRTPTSSSVYWASPEYSKEHRNRARTGFETAGDDCVLWSDLIDQTTTPVRIYQGEVIWKWRDLPDHSQWAIVEQGEDYTIAHVRGDSVVHRDFRRYAARVTPPSLEGYAYYPLNFSAAARDTLSVVPQDDRPYLDDVFGTFRASSPSLLTFGYYLPNQTITFLVGSPAKTVRLRAAQGGVEPKTYDLTTDGQLPQGLVLRALENDAEYAYELSGRPHRSTAGQSVSYTYTAEDANGATVSARFTIRVIK